MSSEKELESIKADREGVELRHFIPKPSDFVFGEGMTRVRVDELRKMLHQNIDHLFDELEFDADGRLVNDITIDQTRDVEGIGFSGSRKIFITKAKVLKLTVGETLNGLQKQTTETIARETAGRGAGR